MSDIHLANDKIDIYAHAKWEDAMTDFHISEEGLSENQVIHNREKYGDNEILENKADTFFYRFRRAFVNPFSIILFVLALISFSTELLMNSGYRHDFSTALIIICMLIISGTVRLVQEMQAKKVSDNLLSMVVSENLVRRDGQWKVLSSSEIVVGDIVALKAGDRVPGEMRLTKANDLFVSQSMLTGESAILEKSTEPLTLSNIYSYADYKNIAFTGSAVIGGTGEGIVLAVGNDTVFGGIKEKTGGSKSSFDKGAGSIAKVLIRFMCILVPIVFFATGITQGDWGTSILFALSVGVGLTPELLPMVVNACLAKGSQAMGRKQTIVKNIGAMQGFGSMDVLCVDKTGTLVTALRSAGHTVGFMGDGINDAAAMKAADVGISVDTAVDVAKESADIILLEKDLMVLEEGIIEGRKTYANMIKYIKMTASSNFGNMFSVLASSALLPFLPMESVHLIFLNLIYDLSCTAIPWDNVDKEFIKVPRKWDASSVGNFMIWIGPTSSIFDFTTYIFMYFVFCPMFVSKGILFNDLTNHFSGAELTKMRFEYAAMFQAGWFVESMWSQTLVIHMIRTPKIPFIQSRASAPLTLLTFTGIALLTIIPSTGFGAMLGFVALPASYFAYLIPCILLYMCLATSLKKAYVKHYGELL